MIEFSDPTELTLELFDDDKVNLETEDPSPQKVLSFNATQLQIIDPYTVKTEYGNDIGIPPTVTIYTEDGTKYAGVCGFPKVNEQSTDKYTVYTYNQGLNYGVNQPVLETERYSCIGYQLEGHINSFGHKEQRLVLYTSGSNGYIQTLPLGTTTAFIRNESTETVTYSRLNDYQESVSDLNILPSGEMTVTTETGRTFSNIGSVTSISTDIKNTTYVLRDTTGSKVHTTNKLDSSTHKRYTIYVQSNFGSSEERFRVYHNVLGVTWDDTKNALNIVQTGERGISRSSILSYESIKVYDHHTQRMLTLDKLKLLSELETETPIPSINIEERLREAVQNVSYSDKDLAMLLNELSTENGVLTTETIDEDYQLLREADEHFNCIVQYLIQYNWASFQRITDDLLSEEFIATVDMNSIEGSPDPIIESGSTEIVL